ncbi:MAG TPA: NADH-ubiquinone oxidoreductase-F iron-sulfur binding region domain-containing protein, partial [Vicinamibacteria bacterium]|nr:NADH-ubiquinone oxidoreductase-F iron-sulfur binding region domain-containing protein [Vicinamibacteria bacterium]
MAGTTPQAAARADAGILARLEASGLRGRGGGWFPAAFKWRAVRVEGAPAVVVANGAEGEPGSIKDRFVMRTRAGEVVAGLALAVEALEAAEAVIYLKGSFRREAAALEAALAARPGEGAPVAVHLGEDSYIVGEETALLESLEGRRAWPRPKPPLPAAVGLRGQPTLVQNVETLSRVPAAVADPDGFRAREATLVSLWGDVERPGVYEVELGTPVRAVIERHGGAPGALSLVFPAGPSAAPLTPSLLDLPLDPAALREAGSGLGTASMLVLSARRCPIGVAASLAAFFERESCGQCPPCTVGTASLARVLRAVEAGTARAKDLHDLAEVAGFMGDHGYCAHCRTAAAAVGGVLGRVPDEVSAHLAARACPRGGEAGDPFAAGSAERRA